uniref:Fungal lipase-type domain-containing protein n=2 Tax=Opuntia streptacantha TaxID=393608 RepID=A0A7C8ZZ24_OPUST
MEVERGAKPSDREIFGISGPFHLASVDWRIAEHRRSVAASLVQGVYILERDRQKKRYGSSALASQWWQFFHFQCIQILVDQVDSSIFGAIFEYKPYNPNYLGHPMAPQQAPPRYVIAFRGTITKPDTRKRDLDLDVQFVLNGLTRNTRYQTALQAVQGVITQVGPANVWVAGHSLGAAIALQAGKDMAKSGCHIETYLFNPPYASVPIEKLKDPYLKNGIRIASSLATAGLSFLTKGIRKNWSSQQYDPFKILCSWIPYLFVNPKDPVCCEYIGYFEHREKMEALGFGGIERIATKDSIISLLSGTLGRDGEAPHLIPSGFLTKNMVGIEQDLKLAHGIHQWWQPHPYWQCKLHQMT